MNLLPCISLLNKHKQLCLWPHSSCTTLPKTLSFRATNHHIDQAELTTLASLFTASSETVSVSDEHSTAEQSQSDDVSDCSAVETIVRSARSDRLFFEPESTNSILDGFSSKKIDVALLENQRVKKANQLILFSDVYRESLAFGSRSDRLFFEPKSSSSILEGFSSKKFDVALLENQSVKKANPLLLFSDAYRESVAFGARSERLFFEPESTSSVLEEFSSKNIDVALLENQRVQKANPLSFFSNTYRESVVFGDRSDRLFFEPESSSSILEGFSSKKFDVALLENQIVKKAEPLILYSDACRESVAFEGRYKRLVFEPESTSSILEEFSSKKFDVALLENQPVNKANPFILLSDAYTQNVAFGGRSDRLFFEPESTSSILEGFSSKKFDVALLENQSLEKANPLILFSNACREGVALEMESENPYADFKKSMEEMMEIYGMKDWSYLEELLEWYLRMNGKDNYEFIVGAFVDLLVGISDGGVDGGDDSKCGGGDGSGGDGVMFLEDYVGSNLSSDASACSSSPISSTGESEHKIISALMDF